MSYFDRLPTALLVSIVEFISPIEYELKPWARYFSDKLNLNVLCSNPNAVSILRRKPIHQLNMTKLSTNPNPDIFPILLKRKEEMDMTFICRLMYPEAVNYAEKSIHKLDVYARTSLLQNPSAIHMVEKYFEIPYLRHCEELSANPSAVPLLLKYPSLVNGKGLSRNPSPEAFPLILHYHEHGVRETCLDHTWLCLNRNPDVVRWLAPRLTPADACWISFNPSAIFLLEEQWLLRDWSSLSINPGAIDMLLSSPTRIDWTMAVRNPNLSKLIENIPYGVFRIPLDQIAALSANPDLFEISPSLRNKTINEYVQCISSNQ